MAVIIPGYDRWKLHDGSNGRPVCECEWCEADIYPGQEVIKNSEGYFCDMECLTEWLLEVEDYEYVTVEKPVNWGV